MNSQEKGHALVLSGGVGSRFGANQPKQFILLQNKPILIHSLFTFLDSPKFQTITVVIPQSHAEESRKMINTFLKDKAKSIALVYGGTNRHQSCLKGLESIFEKSKPNDLVMIHDAARPLVHKIQIEALWNSLKQSKYEVASIADSVSDTIVEADGWAKPIYRLHDRKKIYIVQTPQIAYAHSLKRMMEMTQGKDHFTDILNWADHCHIQGILIKTRGFNGKLTNAQDLPLLESAMKYLYTPNR